MGDTLRMRHSWVKAGRFGPNRAAPAIMATGSATAAATPWGTHPQARRVRRAFRGAPAFLPALRPRTPKAGHRPALRRTHGSLYSALWRVVLRAIQRIGTGRRGGPSVRAGIQGGRLCWQKGPLPVRKGATAVGKRGRSWSEKEPPLWGQRGRPFEGKGAKPFLVRGRPFSGRRRPLFGTVAAPFRNGGGPFWPQAGRVQATVRMTLRWPMRIWFLFMP